MRFVSTILIAVLSISSAMAEIPSHFSNLPIDLTPAELKASCPLKFLPGEEEAELVRQSLKLVRSEQNWAGKTLATVFAKKIRKRVIAACTEKSQCTPANILKVTEYETSKIYWDARGISGYFVLAAMQASVYAVLFQITKSTGGSVAATLVANTILGRFANSFQNPLNLQVDPAMDRFSQNLVSRADKSLRIEKNVNIELVRKYQNAAEIYTNTERNGIAYLFGPQNDMGNKLKIIQSAFENIRDPSSFTSAEKDQAARMVGIMLFEQRQYHAHLAPDDPEFNALFAPYLRILRTIYQDPLIKDKIWGVIDEAEMTFAKQQNQETYARPAAQRYYKTLTYEWFEKPLPEIVPRKNLLDES